MVARVSTAGSLIQNLATLKGNQSTFDLLSFRIATGKQFQELRDYGNDATRIVDLNQEIKSREAYIRSTEIVEITAQAYDTTLNALAEMTQDLLRRIRTGEAEVRVRTEAAAMAACVAAP